MDQTGGRGSKESRLYFYPEDKTRTLFILDIGTKETQLKDVPRLQSYIRKQWRKEK